jgi:hypothetical protein
MIHSEGIARETLGSEGVRSEGLRSKTLGVERTK